MLRNSLAGGVCLSLDVALFFTAVKLTTIVNATIISALQPVLVMAVAGPLFGERIRRRDVAVATVAVAGVVAVVVLSTGRPEWNGVGDIAAVGALIAWTGYLVLSKRSASTLTSMQYTVGTALWTTVFSLAIGLAVGHDMGLPAASNWLPLAGLALVRWRDRSHTDELVARQDPAVDRLGVDAVDPGDVVAARVGVPRRAIECRAAGRDGRRDRRAGRARPRSGAERNHESTTPWPATASPRYLRRDPWQRDRRRDAERLDAPAALGARSRGGQRRDDQRRRARARRRRSPGVPTSSASTASGSPSTTTCPRSPARLPRC